MHELVRLISLRDWAVKLPGLDKGRKHSVFDGLCESTFQPVGALVLKRFKADCTAERSRINCWKWRNYEASPSGKPLLILVSICLWKSLNIFPDRFQNEPTRISIFQVTQSHWKMHIASIAIQNYAQSGLPKESRNISEFLHYASGLSVHFFPLTNLLSQISELFIE
jgi:hypothetical protein